ncbi:pilus (MSHA type) biogenesis protein MshL [Dasania sp. GY-MA-18]|uniref:Pilus (MSHA type) biogenesis protein MshL n=1 Tax=Dasania phycosphaerae TaxID=2950436 RepID=A0A9J6RL82_9GAMM|nr:MULTISPECIES: pilus (MSHA type) biogenesis protein MshL [Dasania]MCR8923047.1 pilus (MSHA type) biogenesis protein MshL [Dasania sp. GY-MA-18]MCZ0865478.1 pilus (MSHA type) biogenesis protein MshL [Dasania phycosphaerae]MCZ0869203.1 pilus (MSHA type) biogenesis protein MshL [Dasania phycosphaerae]
METRDTATVDGAKQILHDAAQQKAAAGEPPAAISDALLPSISTQLAAIGGEEERFEVYVDGVDARSFFMGLVKDTDYNMVVHPDVSGSISLELRNVTVAEVMDVVREVYGYPYKKRGNLYQVLPGGLQSEVFKIDYLSLKRRGISETKVSAGQVTNAGSSNSGGSNNSNSSSKKNNRGGGGRNGGTTAVGTLIETTTESDFWGELKQTLSMLIGVGEGRNVVVTPQAGVVVVKADAGELEVVREYLRSTELIMRRQVVLEAKILEVQLSDGYQSGINWTALADPGSNNSLAFGLSGSSPATAAGGVFSLAYDTGDFFGVIQLLETQGNVQVLSSPRISTVNNQQAVIKVGQDEFFVTQVSNTTTTSSGGTTSSPEVELTPFFSGIALDVTPQISGEDEIILHIHPSISEVTDQVKTVSLGNSVVELPLALSTIRETDSIVYARSGDVVVLGGLMQDTTVEDNSGMPGLSDVPLLGHLFTQERNKTVKSELVILLKPVIVGADGMSESLNESARRFDQFREAMEPMYFGRQ